MKKLYSLVLTALVSTTLFAQNDAQIGSSFRTPEENQIILSEVTTPPASFRGGPVLACGDSLLIEDNGGNNYSGNMFDVSVASDVYLETFSVNVDAGTWNVAIFYRNGTFVGNNTSSTGWMFLDSAQVTSTTTGDTVLYKVPVNIGLLLQAGNTYAFYVTATDPNCTFNYTNGTNVGDVQASNSFFTVYQGNGGAYPFDVTFSPRVFNGSLYYCRDVTSVDEMNNPGFEVYPNPANDQATLDLTSFEGQMINLNLVNSLGQVVLADRFVASTTRQLDLSTIPTGVYFVQVQMNNTVSTQRLVVK